MKKKWKQIQVFIKANNEIEEHIDLHFENLTSKKKKKLDKELKKLTKELRLISKEQLEQEIQKAEDSLKELMQELRSYRKEYKHFDLTFKKPIEPLSRKPNKSKFINLGYEKKNEEYKSEWSKYRAKKEEYENSKHLYFQRYKKTLPYEIIRCRKVKALINDEIEARKEERFNWDINRLDLDKNKKINDLKNEIKKHQNHPDFYKQVYRRFEDKTRRDVKKYRNMFLKAYGDKKFFICPYCSSRKSLANSEVDHIHPVAKGGLTLPNNLILVCRECNNSKSDMTLRSFCIDNGLDFFEITIKLAEESKDV